MQIHLELTLGALPARPAPGARPGHHSLLLGDGGMAAAICVILLSLSLFSNIRSLITTAAAAMATRSARGGPAMPATTDQYLTISFVMNMIPEVSKSG